MSLEKFFNPQSVAIVGASSQKTKVGYEILHNMIQAGFPGKLYPVNNKADVIEGIKCFPDLPSIGDVPDLVVIVVPAPVVPGIMTQCGKVGVKAVIIITAGFKEVGKDGLALEQRVLQTATQYGIRVIGPNCLGLIAPSRHINASFGGDLPAMGGIGYLSQSGALLAAILDMANASGIGFSKLVSIGNKIDVNELDLVAALGEDDETRVIAGYLESITDGNSFVRRAELISNTKPILLIKSGGTSVGAKAATSHTGSMAGGETAYEAGFERAGIIRCNSIEQQFNYAEAFAMQPLPVGNNVVIITNAGGPGIMAADAIEREGLGFAKLTQATMDKLASFLPAAANIHNPIDVLGDALADRYEFALDTALDDPGVDIALVVLTPQAMTECSPTAEAIVRIVRKKPQKTVLACFIGAQKIAEALRILRAGNIPQYFSPEDAVDVIKAMTGHVRWQNKPKR
ncbi:MAG TPA: CoA-binding protein, partial [Anaerolineales bacterium]